MKLLVAVTLAGCSAVPPPPLVPFHATTSPEEQGETTAMVIVGGAGQPFGYGLGAAIRVEHQTTDRTAVGFDVVVGRHVEPYAPEPAWYVGVRGFGRTNPTERDWNAVTYGVGLSYLDSGNLSASVQLGGAVAATNETFVPYLTLGVAPVLVLRRGRGYASPAEQFGVDEEDRPPPEAPRSLIYFYGAGGFVGFVGDDRRLSLDLGFARGLRKDTPVMSLSLGAR